MFVAAKQAYRSANRHELSFNAGEVFQVIDHLDPEWFEVVSVADRRRQGRVLKERFIPTNSGTRKNSKDNPHSNLIHAESSEQRNAASEKKQPHQRRPSNETSVPLNMGRKHSISSTISDESVRSVVSAHSSASNRSNQSTVPLKQQQQQKNRQLQVGIVVNDFRLRPDVTVLEVNKGDGVLLLDQIGDWYMARHLITGKEGKVPVACIQVQLVGNNSSGGNGSGGGGGESLFPLAERRPSNEQQHFPVSNIPIRKFSLRETDISLTGSKHVFKIVHSVMTARISSLAKTDRGDDVFVVNVFRSHGIRHKVYRNYRDFYSLQLSLISRFPREAGKVPGFARTLPFMPAPVPKVTEEVRRMRRVDIDDYLQRLFRMSANIKQCQLVVDFMRPEAGDESVDGLILETPIPYENDNSVALANGHTGIIPSFLPSNIMDPVKISSFLVANKQQQSSQQQLRKHFRNRPSAATNNNSSPLKIVIPASPEISTELKSAPATAESPSKNEKCWDLDSEATKRPLSATETPASDLFDANLTKDLAKRRSSIDIKSVYVSLNISRGSSVNHQSQHKRLRVQRRVSFTNLCRKLQLKYGEFQQVSAVLNSKNTVCINNDQGLNRILNDSRLQTIVMMIY